MKSKKPTLDRIKKPTKDMGSTILEMPSLVEARRRKARELPHDDSAEENGATQKQQFKIRLANLPNIRRQASILVKERYSQKGYTVQELEEDPSRLTLVAYDGVEAIGTLSVGFDSPAGLLCDERYKAEIDKLRAGEHKVCEFIKLAVMSSSASIPTLAALFHVAFIYVFKLFQLTDVVMEINPHHAMFYERALGFKQLGEETTNPRVNAPAVLLWCDLSYINEKLKKFGGDVSMRKKEKTIYPYGFSPEEEAEIRLRILKRTML